MFVTVVRVSPCACSQSVTCRISSGLGPNRRANSPVESHCSYCGDSGSVRREPATDARDTALRIFARTLGNVTATTSPPQREAGGGPRRRRGYLVAAVILIAVAMFAVIVGAHTDPGKVAGPVDTTHLPVIRAAPAFDANDWINSPPITTAELRGKVVLYDFWTYSCINCQRTFPYIRSWVDRYKAAGLVSIGIHSPQLH